MDKTVEKIINIALLVIPAVCTVVRGLMNDQKFNSAMDERIDKYFEQKTNQN